MDPATLAATGIAAALPYLALFGKEAATGAAGAAGKGVWDWIRGKLTSPAGKEAVEDLEANPEDEDSRKLAEATLSKVLRSDPSSATELARLLEQAGIVTSSQTANVVGDENIVSQAAGSGINVSINKGGSSPGKTPKSDAQ